MNEEELNEIRIKMRAIYIEQMLGWQTKVLRLILDMLPSEISVEVRSAITTSLEAQKKEYEMLPFKKLSAEWADLMSSESHEQFLSICKNIESQLGLTNPV